MYKLYIMLKTKEICYFFTKKQRLTYKVSTFKSSIDNLNHVFNFAKTGQFKKLDYGNDSDGLERKYDLDIRDSEISYTLFDLGELQINDVDSDYTISIDRMFEFIKYTKEGHFEEHVDRKRYLTHTHSICVYPPQNVEGGKLIINKKISIPMSKDTWILVSFPIDTLHASEPVLKGTKYLFKGTASVNYYNSKNVIATTTHKKKPNIKSTKKD